MTAMTRLRPSSSMRDTIRFRFSFVHKGSLGALQLEATAAAILGVESRAAICRSRKSQTSR